LVPTLFDLGLASNVVLNLLAFTLSMLIILALRRRRAQLLAG
jgi:hypothetical protein